LIENSVYRTRSNQKCCELIIFIDELPDLRHKIVERVFLWGKIELIERECRYW